MSQDNYRIPATRNNGNQRDPYTNQPRTEVGPSDVWVPNPEGSSTYPSRPAPLDRTRDPNVPNPYGAPQQLYNPDYAMPRREEDRILRDSQRRPGGLETDGYHLTNEKMAEEIAGARARGERWMPPSGDGRTVEANNMATLVNRHGIPADVADAASSSARYPTHNPNDLQQARAIMAGLQAWNQTRPGRVEVPQEPRNLWEQARAAVGQQQTVSHDRREEATRDAIAGAMGQSDRSPDVNSMYRAVRDIARERGR